MQKEPLSKLQEQAFQAIRSSIIRLEYKPGEKLILKDLSDHLNMGRTPVRESLVRLQQEGLVRIMPQSGTYVTTIDLDRAENARFVREHLEREVAIECCAIATTADVRLIDRTIRLQERARERHSYNDFFATDNLMHQTLFDIAGRTPVWTWLSATNADLERFRLLRVQTKGLEWEAILKEHHALREAIVARQTTEVGFLISQHLHMMIEERKHVVKTFDTYFSA
ncbi:transcriptional regulator, GntR family [Coriobacterium glomerans PW2]|uniref:Transcriptional regulator, GntR family n=1 Tax=Coriobacterium glomerans (strain ATCC 49209 / DSM 20642 / JCM 10262 / PW2) TaxID=700015 RepID=F2NA45_CORGP|nr:transcriptional regulator, GntR family [Coriobacterium glomerans PW2]